MIRTITVVKNSCQCVRLLSTKPFDFSTYEAVNEPLTHYEPGSPERQQLLETLKKYSNHVEECPIVIGDEEIKTNDVHFQVEPFDHQKRIAKFYYADANIIKKAIDTCMKARKAWEMKPIEQRAEIFAKAGDLVSTKYKMDLMASTMMGQAKNIVQADVDAICELADFLRFDVSYAKEILKNQPRSVGDIETNKLLYRGLEGFWAAITPFNFTAIGGHLSFAPALMGNVVVWKPSDTAMLSNYICFKIFREAGLPAGVINFVPADGPVFGNAVTSSPHLAGVNFTGSLGTFKTLWKLVAKNLDIYRTFPRLVGECGGKNFHFIHKSANLTNVINGTVRSAFEYGGQKCSACSRMYVPQSKWPEIKEKMLGVAKEIKLGSALDPEVFLSAVIDDKSFGRIKGYVDHAKSSSNLKIISGGNIDDSKGYFVEPTIIETTDPEDRIMKEEIFAPILTVYPYPDDQYAQIAHNASDNTEFALTGAIYADDTSVLQELHDIFRDSAGNFYINDKSTGSVVGQQPFGGARLSGTNDKAGGLHYLLKFVSQQTVKERTRSSPLTEWRYPSMAN